MVLNLNIKYSIRASLRPDMREAWENLVVLAKSWKEKSKKSDGQAQYTEFLRAYDQIFSQSKQVKNTYHKILFMNT